MYKEISFKYSLLNISNITLLFLKSINIIRNTEMRKISIYKHNRYTILSRLTLRYYYCYCYCYYYNRYYYHYKPYYNTIVIFIITIIIINTVFHM